MPKRGLAFLLANVMFWQPIWAQADGIVVANPNTSLDRAGNGVPIINIATPNGSGLSHNQFNDYNVGAQGVILNNATARTSATQLGGHIIGNPNLQNSGCGAGHPQRSHQRQPEPVARLHRSGGAVGASDRRQPLRHHLQRLRFHQHAACDADHRQTGAR